MDSDIKKIESRIENLEKSIEEIKEALSKAFEREQGQWKHCLLYTSPSPRDA